MRVSHLALLCGVLLAAGVIRPGDGGAAPKPDPWPRWEAHDRDSSEVVDHGTWDRFLKNYVNADHRSGINLVRYGAVTEGDRLELQSYLEALQATAVSKFSRGEQKAFWINLYNAFTVSLVLEHYPVKSIRDIDISPGLFADGPWGAKGLLVEGEKLSLDDIEHRILRPLWKDNRVHYAVNCASLGCPDLLPEAFNGENTERLLEEGARGYVNHPRGAGFKGGTLFVSSIYDWFRDDFGGSRSGVTEHLLGYAEGSLASELRGYDGRMKHRYDWSLNDE